MSTTSFRIAIVGAGPGGLTLAGVLQQHSVPFTIFDLRAKPSSAEFEEPAGSLDLHHGTGLAALEELGLMEEFKAMTDDCSEQQVVADVNGTVLYADDGAAGQNRESRPEILRTKLMQLLLSKLGPSAIHWQHKLSAIKRSTTESGVAEVELDFGPRGKHTFDLVVGADGAWSRVRTLLTDKKPVYAGHQNITVCVRQITTRYPHLAKLVGGGTFFSLGNRHGVVSQRSAQDSARLYVLVHTPDPDFANTHGLRHKKPSDMKSFLFDGDDAPLARYGDVIKELISAACDDETAHNPDAPLDIRPMCTLYDNLDERHGWEHTSGVTVLGDAAHLMPPNGEGVNTAMKDALSLASVIRTAHDEAADKGASAFAARLDALIGEFETDMLGRVEEEAVDTKQLYEMMYGGDNCAETMAEFFRSMGPPPSEDITL